MRVPNTPTNRQVVSCNGERASILCKLRAETLTVATGILKASVSLSDQHNAYLPRLLFSEGVQRGYKPFASSVTRFLNVAKSMLPEILLVA